MKAAISSPGPGTRPSRYHHETTFMNASVARSSRPRFYLTRLFDWIGSKRESISWTLWRPVRQLYLCNDRSCRTVAWLRLHRRSITGTIVLVAHAVGFVSSINVLTESRTPQGAIAWIVTLNTFPYIAVPAYWAVGETHYGEHAITYRAAIQRFTHSRAFEPRTFELAAGFFSGQRHTAVAQQAGPLPSDQRQFGCTAGRWSSDVRVDS